MTANSKASCVRTCESSSACVLNQHFPHAHDLLLLSTRMYMYMIFSYKCTSSVHGGGVRVGVAVGYRKNVFWVWNLGSASFET